tara:strand:- start:11 stop:190 length:180 start_codon:yes stop_codon:yes gene_type:complete
MKDVLRVIEFNYGGHKHSKSILKTPKGDSRYEKMSDEDIIARQVKVLMRVEAMRKKCCK